MADDTTTKTNPPTLRGTIMSLNPKIVLAFFLVIVAASLTVFFTLVLIRSTVDGKTVMDPGTIALLAGFITTFILMAKSAADYQFTSSAGSDKKDDANTAVSKALAEKVPTPPSPTPVAPAPVPASVVVAWWSALSADEQAALTAAAATDPKVQAFVDAAKIGKATPDDLAYLVSKIPPLLTQARVDALKAM